MLSRQEKETVIVFNEGEPLATVNTFNPSIITRLSKLEGGGFDARIRRRREALYYP